MNAAIRKNTPKKGDIWLITPDPIAGRELKGQHYYLVISEGALNDVLGVSLCCPISTIAAKARSESVTVAVDGASTKSGGITGVVLCHQIRAMDLPARKAKFITSAEEYLVDEVIIKLIDLIDPQP